MQNLLAQPNIAVITGVSRRLGLGYAVARQLAERSYHVFLAARDARQAEQLAVELREAGHGATSLILDLASQSSTSQAADRLGELIGHLDVLVNNASAMPDFNTRSALEIGTPALQSFSTRLVEESRQGQFQGVLASAMSMASIVGPLLFSSFYFVVQTQWPGAIWLLALAVNALAVPLVLSLQFDPSEIGRRSIADGEKGPTRSGP
jgi:NAD(P)-dependent dehydrogenase (short-subunit alcohol dehydrogenase family)